MFNIDELKELQKIVGSTLGMHEEKRILIEIKKKIDKTLEQVKDYNQCLWSFYWDCGRSGELEGIFKATKEEVESLIGKNVYFGEVLGKHSEVYGVIEEGEIKLISDDPIYVMNANESGFDPLEYVEE